MIYSRDLTGYFTRTFSEICGDYETFQTAVSEAKIPLKITEENLEILYYLLFAKFGNSHIGYTDELQFKYALCSKIFMYGPSWEKRLELQDSIRELTLEELTSGGKVIYNHAFNPSTAPSTATLEELTKIDSQNTTNYKKSKVEGYAALEALLVTDVTAEFISKFDSLFMPILSPSPNPYYISEVE